MMTSELSEILDKALAEQLDWDAQADNGDNGFEPREDADAIELMVAAAAMVQAMPVMPLPDQAQRAADKETFLMQMEQLPAAEVSAAAPVGLFAWLSQRLSLPSFDRTQKESRPMLPLLVKAAFIITILISSLGGTAVFSASALPGSPGYQVKLLLEDARLSMTDSPANQAALHLAFAQERAEEMAGLATHNRAATQAHLANYQEHWREALQHAGELPDNSMQTMMVQAQTMAGEQEALLEQAQVRAASQVRSGLQEATQSLAQVQTAVTLGLQSQNTYRLHMQNLPEDWPGAGAGPGFGPGECEGDCDPSGGYSPGPGYGPGECPNPDECDQDGEGYGPGECPNPGECDQDGEGYGPGYDDDHPGYDDDDHGNDDSGNDDSGNDESGKEDSGNDDSGKDESGNDNSGNDESGNDDEDRGNDDEDRGNDDEDRGNDDEDRGNDDEDRGNDDEDRGNDDEDRGNDDNNGGDSDNDDDSNGGSGGRDSSSGGNGKSAAGGKN